MTRRHAAPTAGSIAGAARVVDGGQSAAL